MNELTLYGDTFWLSPYFFSVYVALVEKGLPFAVELVAMENGAQLEDGYGSRTVTGRVPSLVHQTFVIAESSAIVEYLEDAFPAIPVLPRDLRERARVRQIMSWLRSDDTLPIRHERSTTSMFYQPTTAALSEAAARARDKLVRIATRVLVQPDGTARPTIASGFSIADADLTFMLMRLVLSGDALPEWLTHYARSHWARRSIATFVSHPRGSFPGYKYA